MPADAPVILHLTDLHFGCSQVLEVAAPLLALVPPIYLTEAFIKVTVKRTSNLR